MPQRVLTTLVLAVVLAFAVPGLAMASGTIFGKITAPVTGDPLPWARIEATEYVIMAGPELRAVGYTNASGDYALNVNDVGTGDYRLRIIRPGYITQQTGEFTVPGVHLVNRVLARDEWIERLADQDRYSTAVKVARDRYTMPSSPADWRGVMTVVIASGEDRAAADPLAAAGLCGAYDAPLLLVNSNGASRQVKAALAEMVGDGQPLGFSVIRVIIVGGPVSVPDSVYNDLKTYVEANSNGELTKDRLVTGGDRYDLAAAVARRMKTKNGGNPQRALVANGADAEKFFDPLALSTIAAAKGYPILLVSENGVPNATRGVLSDLGNPDVVVGGGPATVSNSVVGTLDTQVGAVERWWGNDRYSTATTIADKAIGKGWLSDALVGVAAKLPDALSGGAMIGQLRGVLIITDGQSLPGPEGTWISTHRLNVDKCYVIGGPASVSPGVENAIQFTLQE